MILPSTFTFQGGIEGFASIAHVSEILKQLNVHSFEAGFTEAGDISMASMPQDLAKISTILSTYDMEIRAMSTTLLSRHNLIQEDGTTDHRSQEIIFKMIDTASYLGIPYISFHCSSSKTIQALGFEAAFMREFECLIKLACRAEEKNVICCVENYIDGLLCYPNDVREILKRADISSLWACLDTGNSIYAGLPERWIQCLKENIKLVHFSDVKMRMLRGIVTEFVEPGKGTIDFKQVYKQLKNVGYNGDIVLESFAGPKQNDMEVISELLNQFSFIE